MVAAVDESRRREDSFRLLAFAYARDAHENNFHLRRGIWLLEDVGILCVFNNAPTTGRDEETAEFRRRMGAAGIEELAYATYPSEGQDDAGYTYAMLLKAGHDRMQFVYQAMLESLKAFAPDP